MSARQRATLPTHPAITAEPTGPCPFCDAPADWRAQLARPRSAPRRAGRSRVARTCSRRPGAPLHLSVCADCERDRALAAWDGPNVYDVLGLPRPTMRGLTDAEIRELEREAATWTQRIGAGYRLVARRTGASEWHTAWEKAA